MSFPPPFGQEPLQPQPPQQPAAQQPAAQPPAAQQPPQQPAPAPQYGHGASPVGNGYGYGQTGGYGPGYPGGYGWPPDPRERERRRRRNRRVLIAVAGAVVFVVVAAVGLVRFGFASDPTKELEARYTQAIDWQDCGHGYYCGSIEAPLDWQSATTKSVHIALLEHRPTGQAAGAILVNPGGPGGSGVDLVSAGVTNAVDKTIAGRYDVIGFDPPGVGYSSAVKCYDAKQTDRYLYGILPGEVGSSTWVAAQKKVQKAFADACQKNTGDLLAHVDTASAARDMDLIRADLGESKLNYVGYSYGTYLGTVYAGLFPHRVGRFAFDGAENPWYAGGGSSIADDGSVQQAVGFENDLKAWMKACLAGQAKATGSGSCPVTASTVDQGMNAVKALLAKVQAHPETNSDGRKLGAATLATAISSALYVTSEWPMLASAIRGVQAGDPKAAFTLADEYNDRTSKGKYVDNTAEAFQAITCLDDGGDSNMSDLRKEFDALKKKAPVLGPYASYGELTCDEWPVSPVAFPDPVTATGSGPILIVGNTGDPATPYAGAKALAKQLSNGHLLTYVGEGHTIYGRGNTCIDSRVDAYLETGKVPASGTRCR